MENKENNTGELSKKWYAIFLGFDFIIISFILKDLVQISFFNVKIGSVKTWWYVSMVMYYYVVKVIKTIKKLS